MYLSKGYENTAKKNPPIVGDLKNVLKMFFNLSYKTYTDPESVTNP